MTIEQSFQELYPRAVRLAQRILGERAAAEDVAAEALTRAFVEWERIGALAYRDAWVLRTATNLALDVARRPAPRVQPAEVVEFEDLVAVRIALAEALAALPQRQREAIVLRYLAGMSQLEVAAALGVTAGTVATHIHRGIRALRRVMVMRVHSIDEALEMNRTGRLLMATVKQGLEVDIGIPARLTGLSGAPAPGTELEVSIVAVNKDTGVVLVGIPLQPEEVERRRSVVASLQPGDRRSGSVRSVVKFGAFVDIEDQVYGLVHVSEMGGRTVGVGDVVDVEVLATDPERGRLSFRLA